jgi:hypothetical protein
MAFALPWKEQAGKGHRRQDDRHALVKRLYRLIHGRRDDVTGFFRLSEWCANNNGLALLERTQSNQAPDYRTEAQRPIEGVRQQSDCEQMGCALPP